MLLDLKNLDSRSWVQMYVLAGANRSRASPAKTTDHPMLGIQPNSPPHNDRSPLRTHQITGTRCSAAAPARSSCTPCRSSCRCLLPRVPGQHVLPAASSVSKGALAPGVFTGARHWVECLGNTLGGLLCQGFTSSAAKTC